MTLDPDRIRAAVAAACEQGWTLKRGTTLDSATKCLCPLGALALSEGHIADIDEEIETVAAVIGTMTPRRLFQIATRAREILERDGWKQGGFGTRTGPKCQIGLLREAVHGDVYVSFKGDLYTAELRPCLNVCAGEDSLDGNPAHWNDTPGRTKSDIRRNLDALASLALGELAMEETP